MKLHPKNVRISLGLPRRERAAGAGKEAGVTAAPLGPPGLIDTWSRSLLRPPQWGCPGRVLRASGP